MSTHTAHPTPATPHAPASSHTPASSTPDAPAARLFYPASALLCLVITLVGFQHFYFKGQAFPGRPLTPPIKTLLIVHGITMLAWILLFILQPTLVRLGKVRAHMLLGSAGALFALGLVVSGWLVGIHAAKANPPDLLLFGMLPPQFLYVPLTAISFFGIMVTLAVCNTHRPALHRALMLIATVAALSAAMGRIDWLNTTFDATLWFKAFGPLHSSVTLALLLLAARCLALRRFDAALALPVGALALAFAVMHAVSMRPQWDAFARFLMN